MKPLKPTLILIIGLISLTSTNLSFGQAWADANTSWFYSSPPSYGGYYTATKIADTTLTGKTCDVIDRKVFYFNSDDEMDSMRLGLSYTYFADSTVFIWNEDLQDFHTLYKLNGKVGDQWIYYGGKSQACEDASLIEITETGWINMDNQNLKYIKTKTLTGKWDYYDIIVDRIGCLNYLLPEQGCIADLPTSGAGLRCFYNNNMSYNSGIAQSCDEVTIGLKETFRNPTIQIYPNPASNHLRVTRSPDHINQQISIYSIQGQYLHSYQLDSEETIIDLTNFQTGVYVIILPDGSRSKFLKI